MIPTGTIAAIATPLGQSGIGIVRLSGPDAITIAGKMFRSSRTRTISPVASFRQYYGWITEPFTGEAIDEVILSVMRAPRTYTREHIAELNCHGGIVSLRKTLDIALSLGARLAEPGEFTKRAFINGRIDLAQAESVLDIIQAKSERSLKMATGTLRGRLSKHITTLRHDLLELFSQLEAEINFPEDEIATVPSHLKQETLGSILKSIQMLVDTADRGSVFRDGITVALTGRVNVGKSSILNALLRRDRAIVSSSPGTTRDTIEETIVIRGLPIRLIDTAGFAADDSPLHQAGIRRTEQAISSAHLALAVVDNSAPLQHEDRHILRLLARMSLPTILVINKIDLPHELNTSAIESLSDMREQVEISAKHEWNIDTLEEVLVSVVQQHVRAVPSEYMINLRQRQCLEGAGSSLKRAKQSIESGLPSEFTALDVREAIAHLDKITGKRLENEVLEQIFSRFCIGK